MARGTKFDKKITIKRPSYSQDEDGSLLRGSLTTLFECYARIRPTKGIKRVELMRYNYSAPKTVTIRKRSDYTIESTDLVFVEGIEYQISDVYETEDDFFTVMDIQK